jgi:hypothetical protein
MYLKRAIAIFLFLVASQVCAAENLTQLDYDGIWNSNYVVVKNEKQILKISLGGESIFERHFENGSSQMLNTTNPEVFDDLLVLTFTSPDKVFAYKLALSGWKSGSKKALYDSMFMYRNGVQFNMLPVSYEPTN